MNLPLWYEDGLKFKCTGCGACCTGDPGYVWLSVEDIERLATHFKLDEATFLKRYTRNVSGRISLIEIAPSYDCILLKDNKCTAYDARPKQCRKFPWWPSTTESKEAWDGTRNECEGINHPDGKHYTKDEIQKLLSE